MASSEYSTQFKNLPPRIRELILGDMAASPDNADSTTPFSFAMSTSAEIPAAMQGSVFKDAPGYTGTVGPLSLSDVQGLVAPKKEAPAPKPEAPAVGALTLASPRQAPDIQALLAQFVPEDNSSNKYLAMAAALGQKTEFGTFGERAANVANALMQQKENQQALRAKYLPLIMTQVAAQQAREENQAFQAQQAMQQNIFRAEQSTLDRQGRADAAARHDETLKALRGDKPAPTPHIMTTTEGVFERGPNGWAQAINPATGKPFSGKTDPTTDAAKKPLPAAALKMQQDALDAIGVSSSINADLGAVEKQIETGKLKFGPVSNLANKAMNAIGASTEESRNFASFNSTLERLRNESLRLNTGVQTDGDAQRAWNELFQNISDTEFVKERLRAIQKLNTRGAELQQLKMDAVRANYGHDPLDTSAQRSVAPALGGAAPGLPSPADVQAELARRAKAKGQ